MSDQPTVRDHRQAQVFAWAIQAFGVDEATDTAQRGLRLLEEAIETFQACGGGEEIAHKLVRFVYSRPSGTVTQEIGGVSITLLVLAAALGFSAEDLEKREAERVLSRPVAEFTARNAVKNAAGFKVTT